MRIEYTAKRNISTGHEADEAYEIVVLGQSYEDDFAFQDTRNISLDRSRMEVDYWGFDRTIDVTTDLIPVGTATEIFEEFLHSVAGGEQFTIDLASDVSEDLQDPLTVQMMSSRYRRAKPINGYIQYSFTVRVI